MHPARPQPSIHLSIPVRRLPLRRHPRRAGRLAQLQLHLRRLLLLPPAIPPAGAALWRGGVYVW